MSKKHLTGQQERFAELVALGFTLAEAYRKAYPTSENTKGTTLWPNARQASGEHRGQSKDR